MLKLLFIVEIIYSLKHVRDFGQNGWTNVRQCHLGCVGFAEGAF